MSICVCVYVYFYTRVHVSLCVCVCMCVCLCVCERVCVCSRCMCYLQLHLSLTESARCFLLWTSVVLGWSSDWLRHNWHVRWKAPNELGLPSRWQWCFLAATFLAGLFRHHCGKGQQFQRTDLCHHSRVGVLYHHTRCFQCYDVKQSLTSKTRNYHVPKPNNSLAKNFHVLDSTQLLTLFRHHCGRHGISDVEGSRCIV